MEHTHDCGCEHTHDYSYETEEMNNKYTEALSKYQILLNDDEIKEKANHIIEKHLKENENIGSC